MDVSLVYSEVLAEISPIIILSGALAFTLAMIVMLINMVISAATGKGFHIGLK